MSVATQDRSQTVVEKYEEVFEIYTDPKSRQTLAHVETHLFSRDYELAENMLKHFKTEDELMQALEEKLNGKPVATTLKRIRKGVIENNGQLLKGLFSLGTHCSIEIEQGRCEYLAVAKRIHEKIGVLLNANGRIH